MIYIVIPVHNRLDKTVECLKSLELLNNENTHTILVDDGSTDNTSNTVESKFPKVEIIKGDGELFWTGAVRFGIDHVIKKAQPNDWLVLMNNDVIIKDENLLNKLINFSNSKNRRVLAAPLTLSQNGLNPVTTGTKVKSWFLNYTKHIYNSNIYIQNTVEDVDLFTARFLLHPIEIFDRINYRNKIFPHYAGDDDFSWQAKKLGFSLNVLTNINVYLDTSRDYTNIHNINFLKRLIFHLFDKKSSINLRDRIIFGFYCAPHLTKISYILISCLKSLLLGLKRSLIKRKNI